MKNIKRTIIKIATDTRCGFYDVTDQLQTWVEGEESGLLHVFLPHTTAGLVISDKMDTVTTDVQMIFARLFPEKDAYVHRSPNSDAHTKSVVCGCEVTIPVEDGRLMLGEWQRVFIVEGDGPSSARKLICSFL